MFSNTTLSNPLNLFPSTFSAPATQVKLQKLLDATTNRPPTEIQRTLAYSLFDDGIEYMTTLEMNRAASFTYGYHNSYGQNETIGNIFDQGIHGESMAKEMWELLLDAILHKFTQHSPLALTKTIHLIQHVLLYGSEHSVVNGELLYRIELALNPLKKLNTAIVEQQMIENILNNEDKSSVFTNEGLGLQLSSITAKATATMLKLRGGSVDKGFPIREAASKLYELVLNPSILQQKRMDSARDVTSIVPIGDSKKVGFITDEGRYRVLQQKMVREENLLKQKQWQEEQKLKATRSNLAGVSATDGFGGGFASSKSDGRLHVVGAAHSLEDMIKSAKYEIEQHKLKQEQMLSAAKKGYADNPMARARQVEELERDCNRQHDPKLIEKEKALRDALEYLEEMQRMKSEEIGDLLDCNSVDRIPKSDMVGSKTFSAPPPQTLNMCDGEIDLLGFDEDVTEGNSLLLPNTTVTHKDMISQNSSLQQPSLTGFPMKSSTNLNKISDLSNVHQSYLQNSANTGLFSNFESDLLGIGVGLETLHTSTTLSSFDLNTKTCGIGASDIATIGHVENNTFSYNQDESIEAEHLRKMEMAAELFAGVIPAESSKNSMVSNQRQIPAFSQQGFGDSTSSPLLEELIPVSTCVTSPQISTGISVDISSHAHLPPFISTFGNGLMGGSSCVSRPSPPPLAPPPPPMELPPPLPSTTFKGYTNNPLDLNTSFSAPHPSIPSNLDKDVMMKMITQQQSQLQEMMKMMASMSQNEQQKSNR